LLVDGFCTLTRNLSDFRNRLSREINGRTKSKRLLKLRYSAKFFEGGRNRHPIVIEFLMRVINLIYHLEILEFGSNVSKFPSTRE